ncbi:MAG: JmjC domain-containing protein, partial [Pseudonocardiaceae bacterium]
NELHPDACLTQQVTRRGQTLPVANMDCLGQLLRSGCTVVLDALDSFDPTMEIACRALQWWSREVVQVNTYLTTNDAAGFSLHWDDHDVVIVQIAGEKSWEVRGTSRLVPMYRDAEPNREPSNEVVWSGTMRAGDVMHIPRGYWHQATRADLGAGYRSDPDRDLLEHALSLGVRGLDTAFNYRDFTSHTQLARAAGELLGEFTVSTKVGFFPGDDSAAHAVHSLDRARLWEAVERSRSTTLAGVRTWCSCIAPSARSPGCPPAKAATG